MNIKFETAGTVASRFQNLFQGRFIDISPLWFYEVGTVILMTMVINIATNPIALISTLTIKEIKKFYDQSTLNNKKN